VIVYVVRSSLILGRALAILSNKYSSKSIYRVFGMRFYMGYCKVERYIYQVAMSPPGPLQKRQISLSVSVAPATGGNNLWGGPCC